METLSPEQTAAFRAQQKKRARVVMAIAVAVVVALFVLTIVKGHLAEQQRASQLASPHESY